MIFFTSLIASLSGYVARVPQQDQILYQTERYHTQTFGYDMPVQGKRWQGFCAQVGTGTCHIYVLYLLRLWIVKSFTWTM